MVVSRPSRKAKWTGGIQAIEKKNDGLVANIRLASAGVPCKETGIV